ncbi:MAG TPA: PfkB family carbohydrate kinase [Actinophytocola sp.]|uniref:carbohydrate kinase family protein n=1 Tax=Actinophytocola sp. TaxID=1872138 RepID=UPI002DBC849F|nr:PfkB family carbohydrate kinase [Actinophytocola sp.]HEU5469689.1 PfkB family carbohydrate kinase [Actinophytocola sp.]
MLQWIAGALPHTDYLLPNDEQVLGLTGAEDLVTGSRALIEAGVGCVAVTQGRKGAIVVTADEVIEVPAFKIDVVDTTGCGDAFSAGFVMASTNGASLTDAARLRHRCPGRAGAEHRDTSSPSWTDSPCNESPNHDRTTTQCSPKPSASSPTPTCDSINIADFRPATKPPHLVTITGHRVTRS